MWQLYEESATALYQLKENGVYEKFNESKHGDSDTILFHYNTSKYFGVLYILSI